MYIFTLTDIYGAMPNHRPQGRTARPEASSRKGQFYDSEIEQVFDTSFGELTKRHFMSKLNQCDPKTRFSTVIIDLADSKFSRKSCVCGGQIQILRDGRAVCDNPHCSTVFNDGGNTEGMLKITDKYDSGKIVEVIPRAPPPKNHEKDSMRGMHRFFKACRA